MESHGPQADNHVPRKGDEVDISSPIAQTITDAQDAEVHEDQVGSCVEKLCNVRRDIEVFLAPIERGGMGAPDAIAGFAVRPLKGQSHGFEDGRDGPERMNDK